jgi:uncharacterized protein (DUF1499 family)
MSDPTSGPTSDTSSQPSSGVPSGAGSAPAGDAPIESPSGKVWRGARAVPVWAWFLVGLSAAAALLPLMAGLGSRFGWWPFRTGFAMLQVSVYADGAAAVLGAVGLGVALRPRWRGALPVVLAATLVPLFPLFTILSHYHDARTLPRIHDITTDFAEPPAFHAVIPLRPAGSNSLDYDDPRVAALQAAAYPDIAPVLTPFPPDRAFELAKALAHGYRWEVVREDPAAGEIEAVDTTLWFGFKDDISIRIRPHGDGSRVDIRSVSRVGLSDAGANARRIRRFIADFSGP